MKLFDDIARKRVHVARAAEASFEFFNTVDNPWFAQVRDVLELWFARLPAAAQSDIRGRFRKKADGAFDGAFWELYLHELLSRSEYSVAAHPELPGTDNRPDYLASRDGQAFYLEATAWTGPDSETSEEQRAHVLRDALDRLRLRRFSLGLYVNRAGPNAPPAKELRKTVRDWCESHDPDAVQRYFERMSDLPRFPWSHEGWEVEVVLTPLMASSEDDKDDIPERAVGIYAGPGGGFIDNVTPLLNVLERKAKRYGKPPHPLVLAVLSNRWSVGHDDIAKVLFGIPPFGQLQQDDVRGLWRSHTAPRNRHVSAVIWARWFRPEKFATDAPRVWHNPWATQPLDLNTLPLMRMDIDWEKERAHEITPDQPINEVLDLPSPWPVGEPWDERETSLPHPI